MGMAAGQARLLSITSRMSDNELRAQLINNDKMRLATKSSQVSEAYVQALNEANLMFANYDKDNNASYQQLTFNALTAYNPYNNQYALTNASGKILVSENDANNFKNTNSLEAFLGKYGLEQTTTYWNSIATADPNKREEYNGKKLVFYPTTSVDDKGNTVYSEGYKPDVLRKMYEGQAEEPDCTVGIDDDNCHNANLHSYMDIKSSDFYYNYTTAVEQYETARDNMLKQVYPKMLEILKGHEGLEGLLPKNTPIDKLKDKIDGLMTSPSYVKEDWKQFLTNLATKAEYANDGYDTYNLKLDNGISQDTNYIYLENFVAIDTNNRKVYQLDSDGKANTTSGPIAATWTDNKDDTNNFDIKFYYTEDTNGVLTFSNTPQTGYRQVIYEGVPKAPAVCDNDTNVLVKVSITEDEKAKIADDIINTIYESVYTLFDPNKFIGPGLDAGAQNGEGVYAKFIAAGNNLLEILSCGDNIDKTKEYGNFDFYDLLTDPVSLLKEVGNQTSNEFIYKGVTFKQYDNILALKNVQVLDAVMDTYGEPKFTWIDKSSPNKSYNENATAKAQWYTNLYERMQKGYSVLKDGLASSSEWIRFAFESGIVTMQQVDSYNNWNNLIYTNCSDITEQTDAAAVAKAEAEYNAAMNKIENKDKMYDLELKNIDTEHNSLQTEYESIKTAIDKHIERAFKIYS